MCNVKTNSKIVKTTAKFLPKGEFNPKNVAGNLVKTNRVMKK